MTADAPPPSEPAAPVPGAPAPDPAPAPAPAAAEGAATPAAGPPASEGVDKQLVALAIGLWILAMIVIGLKWNGMRVDWHLGTLRKARASTGQDDPAAVDALVALAEGSPAALTKLRDEVLGSQRQRPNADAVFRAAVMRVIARVKKPEAMNVLLDLRARDPHPLVRGLTYEAMGERASHVAAERAAAIQAGLEALAIPGDGDALVRGYAGSLLARLGAGPEAVWPVLRSYRDSRPGAAASQLDLRMHERARTYLAAAVTALAGAGAPALNPMAELPARDAEVRAFEAWWLETGHSIPSGERLDEVHATVAAPGSASVAAPGSATPPPNTPNTPPEDR